MKCSDFQQLVALFVEEDLSAGERHRVKEHLRECSDCWDLAEDLQQSQALFKSIRQDVPDATALSVLRERVLGEVCGLESMTWFERFVFGGLRRKTALASIALVLVGSGALWLARSPHIESPLPMAGGAMSLVPQSVTEPPVESPIVPPVRPGIRQHATRALLAAKVQGSKQITVKLLTDDPNVIIYWLVDEKGE